MRLSRSRIGLLVALSLGLSACQGAPSARTPSGSGSPTAASVAVSADSQRCERLAKRGFTPCPPTPDKLQLPPTTIRNATNGAISDATAQQWGRAFQLTQAYYRWAMQNGVRDALTSGVLADSGLQTVGNLFGTDLRDLDAAKQVDGRLVYEPSRIPITQVVSIPADLQESMRRQGLMPSSYGLAVRFTGPTRRSIRFADGHETVIVDKDASAVVDGIIWGEVRSDRDLGPIWFEHGVYGCDGAVRVVCEL
jgi:hypothetical protein